ncbi:MAG: BCCT family transporter [Deltaproteobacteria bacterium]|jgi:choline-glycine betaine transporter|nr:BCCT family transporter [Deltaproteobacteria bacterium]
MQTILSIAILVTLLTSLIIVLRWGNLNCEGPLPTSLFAFIAILFTSGLDVGLIMLPLTEFPVYAEGSDYQFANPLAVEFGFWGFLVWVFYFLTTFYFCIVEPHVKLFEIPFVKLLNNAVVVGTSAFTGYLFLRYLPNYIDGLSEPMRYGLVALVVFCAVFSSTEVRYVKILSVASTWVFFGLIAGMWLTSDMGIAGFAVTLAEIGDYFANIHRFVTPITDYHAFYLFWWFSWSIMIGQFVSRFVGGLKTWQLLVALLIIPSILIAIWFSVLYYHFANQVEIIRFFSGAMVIVGIVFVINSLDSLMRLYTVNLNLTVERFGRRKYMLGNWTAMFGLILLYQFTPLKIEWIGLVVVGLYAVIYALLFNRRRSLTDGLT